LTYLVSQPVNPPAFQSLIRIYNAITNTSISQIDVSSNASNVTYVNDTLTFYIPAFNISDEFYITFDAGVLFSNSTVNSAAQTDPNFWHLKVIAFETTTSITTTLESTPTVTTYSATTDTSMTHSDTSAFTGTTVTITHTSANQTIQNLNTTTVSTTTIKVITGRMPTFYLTEINKRFLFR
jgi:hypothetical protein